MAGASLIHVTLGTEPIEAAMRRLLGAVQDLRPALLDIGEHLLNSTRERFSRMESPAGEPWAKLSDRYAKRKKKNVSKLLVLDGHLRNLLRYQVTGDELALGTNRIYGAIHQLGGDAVGIPIPARPYLGLSAEDENAIIQILAEHVSLEALT